VVPGGPRPIAAGGRRNERVPRGVARFPFCWLGVPRKLGTSGLGKCQKTAARLEHGNGDLTFEICTAELGGRRKFRRATFILTEVGRGTATAGGDGVNPVAAPPIRYFGTQELRRSVHQALATRQSVPWAKIAGGCLTALQKIYPGTLPGEKAPKLSTEKLATQFGGLQISTTGRNVPPVRRRSNPGGGGRGGISRNPRFAYEKWTCWDTAARDGFPRNLVWCSPQKKKKYWDFPPGKTMTKKSR